MAKSKKKKTVGPRKSFLARLRGNFLAGIVIVAPVVLTAYLAWAVITFGWRLPPISLTGANTNASPAPARGCGTPDASEQEPLPSVRIGAGWRSTTAPAKTTDTASVPSSSTWIIHPGCWLEAKNRSWNLWRNTNAKASSGMSCSPMVTCSTGTNSPFITEPPTP